MDFLNRIARLRAAISTDDLEGIVVRRPANVTYLTGFATSTSRPCLVVVGPERVALVAPGRSEDIADHVPAGVAVYGYATPGATVSFVADVDRLSADALEAAANHVGLVGKRFGYEDTQISALHASLLHKLGSPVACHDHVQTLRQVKDREELTRIRRAVALNDLAFAALRESIRPGITEFDLAATIVRVMQDATGAPIDVLDETNCIISGPRTANGVGLPTNRKLQMGDLVIVDINPFVDGYKGDTTRTFVLGEPHPEHRRIYETLVCALESAERIARPGVRACDVYAALVQPIVAAGYGAGLFGHGGHAIGLEHLERPYIIEGDEMLLDEGMVLTLEPGVYLRDIGGLRVEDDYLVTARGLEVLSHFPRELIVCN